MPQSIVSIDKGSFSPSDSTSFPTRDKSIQSKKSHIKQPSMKSPDIPSNKPSLDNQHQLNRSTNPSISISSSDKPSSSPSKDLYPRSHPSNGPSSLSTLSPSRQFVFISSTPSHASSPLSSFEIFFRFVMGFDTGEFNALKLIAESAIGDGSIIEDCKATIMHLLSTAGVTRVEHFLMRVLVSVNSSDIRISVLCT